MVQTVAEVVGITVAVVGGWQGVLRWRAHGTPEARRLAAATRGVFDDVLSLHGLTADKFLSDDSRSIELGLDDLIGRLRDAALKDACGALLAMWKAAWASSPPPLVMVAVAGRPPVSSGTGERREQVDRQVDAARLGLEAATGMRNRCDRLERFIVGR